MSVQAFARRTRTAARVIRLSVPFALACAALLLGVASAAAAGPLPPNITSLSFTQNPRTGQDIVFSAVAADDNSGGSISGYDWDFGDGTAHSSTPNPLHTYAAGNYIATVVVTDSDGAPAMQSVAVPVHGANRPPAIDFAASFDPNPDAGVAVDMEVDATDDKD